MLIVNASSNRLGGNRPGDGCTGACNLISGNAANGVGIWKAAATGNTVSGNLVGTDASGSRAVPNGDVGVESQDAPDNTISGNLLSFNPGAGVSLTGSLTTGNKVSGNVVRDNKKMGVNIGSVDGGSSNAGRNTISGNTISGNAWSGVYISGSTGGHNKIEDNTIGPNTQDGVGIKDSPGNAIERNQIRDNGSNGVAIVGTAVDNTILANGIDGNAVVGIAIGATREQAAPTLMRAIEGTLSAAASTSFRIEFFHSPACNKNGRGQGRTYIGGTPVSTDGRGAAAIRASFPGIPTGAAVTATATRMDGARPVETSEFSNCVTAPKGAAPVSSTPRTSRPPSTAKSSAAPSATEESPLPSASAAPAIADSPQPTIRTISPPRAASRSTRWPWLGAGVVLAVAPLGLAAAIRRRRTV